ncbi:hypothetical protein [Endozoicomonas sp. ALE010]|uniref:hypothetical protein n=1 Tax=Endozoicomonas sp. ALE010 TaxID=3403081 RepID=UPI003BB5F4EB
MPSSIGAPAPQVIVVEPHKRDWTIVRWCHKVADSVSRKFDEGSTFGKWLGRAVAAVFVPFGILPSLVGDAIHGIRGKDLSDRRVETTQAVEKKIPTMEEFAALKADKEALIADKEALLKRVSAAEADARQAKLEKEDLNICAESQADALVRIAHEEKQELLKKAQDKFNKERESKVRCIRRQHKELQFNGVRLKRQERILKELQTDRENYKAVAIHHKNKTESLRSIVGINFLHAFRETNRSISTEKELVREQKITRFMAEELTKERQKTWQEKYLNDLFKDFKVKHDSKDSKDSKDVLAEENLVSREELQNLDINSVVKVEMNEDGKDPIFNLTVLAPGAVKRVVSINLSQLNILLDRMDQFYNERVDFEEGVHVAFKALEECARESESKINGLGQINEEDFDSHSVDDNAGKAEGIEGIEGGEGEQPLSFDNSALYFQPEEPAVILLSPLGQNATGNQPGAEVSVDKQDSESVKTNNGEEGV